MRTMNTAWALLPTLTPSLFFTNTHPCSLSGAFSITYHQLEVLHLIFFVKFKGLILLYTINKESVVQL